MPKKEYTLVATRQDNCLGYKFSVYKGKSQHIMNLLFAHPKDFIIENYSDKLRKELDQNPRLKRASRLVSLAA